MNNTQIQEVKRLQHVGEKNLDYEITKFGFNAQPLYMFIDADAKCFKRY